MNYYEDPKDMNMAINGRMMIRITAVILLINSVFDSLIQGISFTGLARAAKAGEEQAVELLNQGGYTAGQMNILGICAVITAAIVIMCCVLCLKLSNRLDQTKILLAASCVTFAVTAVYQCVLMFGYRLATPMGVLASVLIPALLIWSVFRYKKLFKKYPDKVYAVMTRKIQESMKKTEDRHIMERATRKVQDEKKVSDIIDEISE